MNESLGRKIAYVLGAISGAFLSLPLAVQTVVGLMVLDYASGLLAGAIEGRLASSITIRGLAKKALALTVIGAFAWLARGVGGQYDFDASSVVTIAAGCYAVYEMISVLENAKRSGLPLPKILVDKLALVQKGMESGDETTEPAS